MTRTILLPQCKLTVVRGKERGREQIVAGDVIRVGKAPENDLVLDDETVSRAHFEIVRDGKGWLARDLGSTNGTFLDGAEIREAYVRSGSMISAGAVQLRVVPSEERIEVPPFEGDTLAGLAGRSRALREVLAVLARVGPTEASVLLEGEPGTGKASAARALHVLSRRREGPFAVVDGRGGARAAELELWGGGGRPGALERAAGGTIYLLEPAELSADAQARLLRALEAREARRGNRSFRLDVRLVAGTCRDAAADVEKGHLLSALRARLGVVTVRLPPLREREGDVALLTEIFASAAGVQPPAAAEVAALEAHAWPGNLDELRSVVVLGRALGRTSEPGFDEAPFRVQKERHTDDFERRYLTWLMARAGGNISRAARDADMDRKYLHKLLKKHGLATG